MPSIVKQLGRGHGGQLFLLGCVSLCCTFTQYDSVLQAATVKRQYPKAVQSAPDVSFTHDLS
jgi:hypothetical protein